MCTVTTAMDLNASVTLPPEILDKILQHIHANDGRTLIACSLVATWWTGPSQRRIFSHVSIDTDNYQQWANGVVLSGSKTHLLEYVRSLRHCRGPYTDTGYPDHDFPRDSGEYLSALRNIHSLTLFNTRVIGISEEGFCTYFSALRKTLTYLSLEIFSISFSALVTLADYFPNLTTLQLLGFGLEPDEGPVPTLSHPLRGKVHFRDIQTGGVDLFNRFTKLDLAYEELIIDSSCISTGTRCAYRSLDTRFSQGALQISPNTVKLLRLAVELQLGAAATIHNFPQLREFELIVTRPGAPHGVLLSSITSIKLRKIIFLVKYVVNLSLFARGMGVWGIVDEQLRVLVDRLHGMGYRRTLEVELRLAKIRGDLGRDQFTKFLPAFGEKGIVTVIDVVRGDRLFHSSIPNR